MYKDNLDEVAKALMNGINTFSVENSKFVDVICGEHRTLQQSAFRLFYACITKWAEQYETKNYDLRNEATCKACAEIVELFAQRGLYVPMV